MNHLLKLTCSAFFFFSSAFAIAYPTKPITMIIPQAPGGTNDIVGRAVAQRLGEQIKASVIV
jgi:tripartite-type tricarboxylate transporter receptor subunit TctC